MNAKTDEVFVSMQRDYRAVLGGGAPQGQVLPKHERIMRQTISSTLDDVEAQFRKIAAGTMPEEEEADANSTLKDVEIHQGGLEHEASIVPKPQTMESQGEKDDTVEAKIKPYPTIKSEQKEQTMADALETNHDVSEHSASSTSTNVDEKVKSPKRQLTPDALDAQFDLSLDSLRDYASSESSD